MKKVVFSIIFSASTFFYILYFIFYIPVPALAWNDCPTGRVNDPYPGLCSNYLDTNNDGICDHSQSASANAFSKTTNYHLIPISISLTSLYLISYLLSRKKIIDPAIHRKLWNIFLLVCFLVCGISGILLILRLNFGLNLANYARIVFDHVEFGIAMTLIAFFHIFWHLSYFKNLFKK